MQYTALLCYCLLCAVYGAKQIILNQYEEQGQIAELHQIRNIVVCYYQRSQIIPLNKLHRSIELTEANRDRSTNMVPTGWPNKHLKDFSKTFKAPHQHFHGPIVDTVRNSNLCCRHFLAKVLNCKRNRIAERLYTR